MLCRSFWKHIKTSVLFVVHVNLFDPTFACFTRKIMINLILITFIMMPGASSVSLDFPDMTDLVREFSDSFGKTDSENVGQTGQDQELQIMLEEFKRAADKIFEDTLQRTKEIYKLTDSTDDPESKGRYRRTTSDRDEDGVTDEFGTLYSLASVKPLGHLDVTVSTDIEIFILDDVLYFVSTNGSTDDAQDQVKIFAWDSDCTFNASCDVTLIQTIEVDNIYDAEPIDIDGIIYLVVAVYDADDDSAYSRIYKFVESTQEFKFIQRINQGHTLTSTEIEGVKTLLIGGSSYETDEDNLEQQMSTAYFWLGGHFDEFASFETYNVMDIHPFVIHSRFYLALANYAEIDGNVNINSQVLVFNNHLVSFEHFQYLPTEGARDFEYFGFGDSRHREHFLAVVNNPDSDKEYSSVIYKYNFGEFVPFQCIVTSGAERWHAIVDDDTGNFVLLALATDEGVEFYEYDGWWFRTTSYQYRGQSLTVSSYGFVSLLWNNTCMLGVAEGTGAKYNVFELNFSIFSPLKTSHNDLEDQCQKQHDRFHELNLEQERMRNESRNLLYRESTDEQILTGSIVIITDVPVQNLEVLKLKVEEGMVLDEEGEEKLEKIKNLHNNHTIIVKELANTWSNNTMKTYGDQIVTAEKTWDSLTITDDLTAGYISVTTGYINEDISIEDLDTNTARTDRMQTFTGAITFDASVEMESNLEVSGYIDGDIYSEDLVTLSADHTITSHKQFNGGLNISGNLQVDGTLDGISISEDSILLVHSSQTYTGSLTFHDELCHEDDIVIDGLVDGIDLSELKDKAVYHTGAFTITGSKTFVEPVTMVSGMSITNGYLIDDVDFNHFVQTAMRIGVEQEITGRFSFSQDLSILGDLEISGSINDLFIPESVVFVNEVDEVTLYGDLIFDADVVINNLYCTSTIDGITCHADSSGLDILLLSGDQTASGYITFANGIWLDSENTVSGLVDGIDVPALAADTVYVTGDQEITGEKSFSKSVTFEQDIEVDGLIQGVDLTELDSTAVKISEGLIDVEGQLVFEAPVTFEEYLNTSGYHDFGMGLNLDDLVTQETTEVIQGIKTFRRNVVVDGDLNVTGLVNDIYLPQFYRDVIMTTKLSPQRLTGDFNISENMEIRADLNVDGLVDGVDMDNIVKVYGTQEISGETTFASDLLVGRMVVDDAITLTGYVNDHDVIVLNTDTLLKVGDQTVTGIKTFKERLICEDDITLDGLIHYINITAMVNDAVYKTGDHVITADKTFVMPVQFQEVSVTGTVCGEDFDHLYGQSVQQNKAQNIAVSYTFERDVTIETNLEVLGTINGYQLEVDVAEMVLTTDASVDVDLTFKTVTSEGNVDINGLIDSMDVGVEAVLTNVADQTITGSKTLTAAVTLSEDLIAETVCGIDVEQLSETTVYNIGDQTITAHKTFKDGIILEADLYVDGLVDGVDVTYLYLFMMRTDDDSKTEQVVTASGSVENIYFYDLVRYRRTLDGVNLRILGQSYLSLTLPQTISASKIIEGTMTITSTGSLAADGDDVITLQGLIHGVDLEVFQAAVLLNDAGQTVTGLKTFSVTVSFEDNISVDGLVDGIDLSTNLMRTDARNRVTGSKTFTAVYVTGDVVMDDGILVDGVDLSEWKRLAAIKTGDYEIDVDIAIPTVELQQNLIVNGYIDNIKFGLDYVLATKTDQTVTGWKSFLSNVIVEGNLYVDRYINDIDVIELLTNTLLMNRPQVILGDYTLGEDTVFGDITILTDLLNGVSVTQLYRDLHTYPDFSALNETLEATCQLLGQIQAAQQSTTLFYDSVETIQDITTIGRGQWHAVYYNDIQYLMEAKRSWPTSDDCVDFNVYYWNPTSSMFEVETTLQLIEASAIDTFIKDGRLFMVVGSHSDDTDNCFGEDWDLVADPDMLTTHEPAELTPEYLSGSVVSVLVRSSETSAWFLLQHLPCVSPSDVEYFVDPLTGNDCIAISNMWDIARENSRLAVYIYCGTIYDGFTFWTDIPAFGAFKVKHFFVDDTLHLVIANKIDSEQGGDHSTTSSIFWRLRPDGAEFELLDTVITDAASDILVTEVEGTIYIVFANEFEGRIGAENYNVPVHVYEYKQLEQPFLEWRQDIASYGTKSLGQFTIEQQNYLLVLDRTNDISVYKFHGIEMYQQLADVNIPDADNLKVITSPVDGSIQLAVMSYGQYNETTPYSVTSKILQVIVQGAGDEMSDFPCLGQVTVT